MGTTPEQPRPGPVPQTATVLFVDDEPAVLSALRRVLRFERPTWRAVFAEGGEQALTLLADQPIDVIVSDVRMPGMNGAELLEVARCRHPAVARLILSGYADHDLVIEAVGPTQQFLCKPVDSAVLVAALDRVLALKDIVADPRLRELLGGVGALPKPPEIYQRMTAVTADPDYDVDDLVAVIRSDLTTSAEVLRLVNSSYFGLPVRVESVAQAITLLGLATIQALAVAGGIFASGPGMPPGLDAAHLSSHGLAVASTARTLAQAEDWPADAVADMFMAGLLHQIGLPVLAAARPTPWAAIDNTQTRDPRSEHDLYTEHFGCAPTQASAFLLGLWGFPDPVVHAVADQPAEPTGSPASLLLTYARHIAQAPDLPFHITENGYLDAARLVRWQTALVPTNPLHAASTA
jgi:HD-like signal output (HDOD) protein